ncbi:hypothetical protein Tco_1488080 [Tanacetum coccineum]
MARRRHEKHVAPQFVLILRAKFGTVPDILGRGSLTCQSYVSSPSSGQNVLRKTEGPPKDPTEVSKIVRKANETLSDFKERWTEEMGYI